MGLDFTGIQDREGPAVFMIYEAKSVQAKSAMEHLADEVRRRCSRQLTVLSSDDAAARRIIDFYDLRGGAFVLIISDDDQLRHVWYQNEIPQADQISYLADHAS